MRLRAPCKFSTTIEKESISSQSEILSDAYGQRGHCALLPGFGDHNVKVLEHLGDGHGVDLAAGVVTLVHQLLEEAGRRPGRRSDR